MSKRRSVKYIQNEDPSFIRNFKEKIGYQEGPNVDTKRQKLEHSRLDDRPETEEEQPVVVVVGHGDLSAEEAREAERLQKQVDEAGDMENGRIKFKKPTKSEHKTSVQEVGDKDNSGDTSVDKKKIKEKIELKGKDNRVKVSLLSFDEIDDD